MILYHTNEHHNLPRSFGGTSELINRTELDVQEHNVYHKVAGHPPPCLFIRRLVISAINGGPRCLSPEVVNGVLGVVPASGWRHQYLPKSVHPHPKFSISPMRQAMIAVHEYRYFKLEHDEVTAAIDHITHGEDIPPLMQTFHAAALDLLGERDPARALEKVLTDRNGRHGLKWVKPLDPEVVSDLLGLLRGARSEFLPRAEWRELQHVLQRHRATLQTLIEALTPQQHTSGNHVMCDKPGDAQVSHAHALIP